MGVAVWGARYFEGHMPVALHNSTVLEVPLTWILLDIQSTVDLVANAMILVNIRTVRDEDAICVHCNIRVKVVNQDGDLPRYATV